MKNGQLMNIGPYHIRWNETGDIEVFDENDAFIARFAFHDDFVQWLFNKFNKK